MWYRTVMFRDVMACWLDVSTFCPPVCIAVPRQPLTREIGYEGRRQRALVMM